MRRPFLHESRSKTMKIYLSFQVVLTSYKLLEIERILFYTPTNR